MKKKISLLLAVLFSLTAFGGMSIFGGAIGAQAEFYDYYRYVSIPGYEAYSVEGIQGQRNPYSQFVGFTSDGLPQDAPVDKVASFKAVQVGEWNEVFINSFKKRSIESETNTTSVRWAAKGEIDGTDIFGDSGVSFEGASGISFWLSIDGARHDDTIAFILHQVPSIGPYYLVSDDTGLQDMLEYPAGAVYGAVGTADYEGYYHFDFKTDFAQDDWWSVDDDGNNQYQKGNTPIPKSKLKVLNGFEIVVHGGHAGAIVNIGDFRVYYDTRMYTDELQEYIDMFDSLNPEEYTEESFLAASEVYFEAYEVLLEHENQAQIDNAVSALKKQLNDLQPLFHARESSVNFVGFEAWEEAELDMMTAGLDVAAINKEVFPAESEQSVMIMANAADTEPTWGWSWFTSLSEDGVAIGNPFALKEGSAPLSEASGIRFWVKWDESLTEVPTAMKIGIGSSTSGVYFECEDYALTLPEAEGYVGIPWTYFYDTYSGDTIYDYIDELDYISIFLYETTGVYYVSDLHAFKWDISEADFLPLQTKINDTYTYMATLDKNDWYYKSWERVETALSAAEAINGKYGVTVQEVQAAIDGVDSALSKLVPIGDLAKPETISLLNYLYNAGKSYWRGNVTAASYRALSSALETAAVLLDEGPSEDVAQQAIKALEDAIGELVPITAGEKITTIYSFESYSTRDLNRANGDRTEGVVYSLANAANVPNIPEGYDKALKMVATVDMSADNSDEHGVMQFKAMTRDAVGVKPLKIGSNGENTLIGDLTDTDGICLWIGVNDVNLVQNCTFRFAVSNCTTHPMFEMAARDIPLPTTGSGWLYIPWEYFEFYDAWTNGEPIRLNEIYFYILRFNGEVKQGLEVYSTGIHAYKNTAVGEWEQPVISGITDGATIDISETALVPSWNVGSASLDGEYFIFGNSIVTNGEHVLEVRNGDKSASVSFTVTGGEDKEYTVPTVYGVEEGGEYSEPVEISWDTGTATLNGAPFERNATVTELGEYTLIVTNGDKQTKINFKMVEPKPDVMKGDPDGDGMITVADALYTLRIAAQLTEGTADDLLVVDTDGDGSVTVADALAILRVAAQLADSL